MTQARGSRSSRGRRRHLTAAAIALMGLGSVAAASSPARAISDDADPRRLERLGATDRAFLDELIGFAPPPFAAGLTWVGGPARTWTDLRGTVVLVQSWTSDTATGRTAAGRVDRLLRAFAPTDVEAVLLHTPQGADGLQAFLERRPLRQTVVLDGRGTFCDALGAFERPVNVLVDRQGRVRSAGLNARGLRAALTALVAEPFDPDAAPPPPRERSAPPPPPPYPAIEGTVQNANDLRGRPGPELTVETWLTPPPPDTDGKVLVIEFWTTSSGPSVAAVPTLNLLADRFANDVRIIALSDEPRARFHRGLQRHGLRGADIHYTLALDARARMKSAAGVRGLPHVVVMSADGTVRWQGHPHQLTSNLLQQIVDANAAAVPGRHPRDRWAARRESPTAKE